ncbi:MAG TPA: hypothetical protein VFL57_20710 [Bryobacteraceae bacterium]|nr:hypothetical protein [Bryobacteraceae bacterium]
MRYLGILFVCLPALAQEGSSSSTYTFDVNGRRIEAGKSARLQGPGTTASRQIVQSINGREVPLESTEERVVSDDGTTRIIERVTRRYTRTGEPGPPERVRIEERRETDGTMTTAATAYRGDVNGNFQLAERSLTQARTTGGTTTTSTAVERPTLNGGMELVERREAFSTKDRENVTVLRRDQQGRFEEAARRLVERTTGEGGVPVENSVRYEYGRLIEQTVSRTEKVNGAEQTTVDVYAPHAPGRSRSASDAQPVLQEQRVLERVPTVGGAVERVSIRRPDPSNPGRMTAARVVEETVCRGDCK